MKNFYQIEWLDNKEVSQEIFENKIDAWQYAMSDCSNDRDIAHLLERVANNEISIKILISKEACYDTD